ncbi:Chondroitin sulfate proteoglycan 5 [Liparis tanakae]|uniref:Chondroitin sulfate proteoglycan 5 n=1 Tax=Liparis tanakae TaxID=230148 RepID=A0A4Z2EEY1_9TELE|nr:Chondroitin sulfate proteoglycan 5 [Liparis tanakae]
MNVAMSKPIGMVGHETQRRGLEVKFSTNWQDDPNPQNKLEDPVKAQPKEDDSLNIHNSLTPKHENHKVLGEDNSSEVNSLQNNMM